MNSEVFRDLRERDLRITALRDPDHVIAELLRKRLGHDDILPGQPTRASHLRCHLIVQQSHRQDLRDENERHIARLVNDRPLTLLAAWGGLTTSRPYFPKLLAGIIRLTADAGRDWVSLGEPTKYGHPRHPLYVRGETPLQPFDAVKYL